MDQVLEDAELFARVRHWKDYQLDAKHVFATEHALRWFIRKHEDQLLKFGVLLKLPRGTYVDPVPFSAAAINLMRHGRLSWSQGPQVSSHESAVVGAGR